MSVPDFATLEKKSELGPIELAGLNVLPIESLTKHVLRLFEIMKMFEYKSDAQGSYHCTRLMLGILRVSHPKRTNGPHEKHDIVVKGLQLRIERLKAQILAELAGKPDGGRKAGAALLRFKISHLSVFSDIDHYPTDAELVVDGHSIKIHRHLLCMLSPVFNACFSHDTREGKTGIVEITDFDFDVVQSVVDFCYGRKVTKPILHVVRMLRFADKYDIKCVAKKLGHFPSVHLKLDNFCIMARYAWDLEKDDLKEQCVQLYRRNVAELTLTSDFAELPINIREDILHCAIALRRIHADK